jgi:hypothetical protein
MKGGTPINRHILVVLKNGTIVIDWGDDQFLDILTGKYVKGNEKDISHHIRNEELDRLKLTGLILDYDNNQVYFPQLPERRIETLD